MNKNLGNLKICTGGEGKSKNFQQLRSLKNSKLKAAFVKKYLWPQNSTLNIFFMSDSQNIERKTAEEIERTSKTNQKVDPLQFEVDKIKDIRKAIEKIVNERISPIVNLKFNFKKTTLENSQIRIDFDEINGCWSYVGTDANNYKKEATMNFSWFDVQTVIHEFGHLLGMIHEHQNPKNNTIDWNTKEVYKWAKITQDWDESTTNLNIIDVPTYQINGSDYDPLSIMLYFYPPELTNNNKGTKENLRMSPNDVIYINNTYPNKTDLNKFYKKIYGVDIKKNIVKEKLNKNVINNKQNNKNFIIYFIIIIILCIIIYFIFRKKNNNISPPQFNSIIN